MATGPLILVVRNDLGVKTLRELLELAKKEPGKLKFGLGGGVGSSLGVATELLEGAHRHQDHHRALSRRRRPRSTICSAATSTRCSTPCR